MALAAHDSHDARVAILSLLFAQEILVASAIALGATAFLRSSRSRLAPALTTATAVGLLLFVPLGTIVGLWWLLKVRPEESGPPAAAAPEDAPA